MIRDLIVGVIASLIASGIVGFWGNKAVSNSNSVVLKIYVLFLAAVTFISTEILSIVTNEKIIEHITMVSDTRFEDYYNACFHIFGGIAFMVSVVTCIMLLMELMRETG